MRIMDDDAVDKVVTISIAAAMGAILVSSLVIPVFNDMLGSLSATDGQGHPIFGNIDNLSTISTLLGVVLLLVVVAFAISIVRGSLRNR